MSSRRKWAPPGATNPLVPGHQEMSPCAAGSTPETWRFAGWSRLQDANKDPADADCLWSVLASVEGWEEFLRPRLRTDSGNRRSLRARIRCAHVRHARGPNRCLQSQLGLHGYEPPIFHFPADV